MVMQVIEWSDQKNEWLKSKRQVCFEQVLPLFVQSDVLDFLGHPNQERYPGQIIAVVRINDYVHLVPYVADEKHVFLKTIIKSRKAHSQYKETRDEEVHE